MRRTGVALSVLAGFVLLHAPGVDAAHGLIPGAPGVDVVLWVYVLTLGIVVASLVGVACLARRAVKVLGEIVRSQWRLFVALSITMAVAYQFFLLAPFLLNFRAVPNYFKVYDAWGGIAESFQVRPPLVELLILVAYQPVYEFGLEDRFGFIPAQYVAQVHSLFTMAVLPPLVALVMLLQSRAWVLLRHARQRSVAAAGGATSLVATLGGATTSAVACCAASSGPVFLTLLGLGAGTAGVLTDYAAPLETVGFMLLIWNVVGLAVWLARIQARVSCEISHSVRGPGARRRGNGCGGL